MHVPMISAMRVAFPACLLLALAAPLSAQLPEGVIDVEARSGIQLRGAQEVVLVGATPAGQIAVARASGEMLATLPGGVEGAATAFCLWRPPGEQILHGYLGDDTGQLAHHLLLFDQQDSGGGEAVTGYHNRTLALAGAVRACAVDEARGALYVAVAGDGIRRFDADVPRESQSGASLGAILSLMRGLTDENQTGGVLVLPEADIGWPVENLLVREGEDGGSLLLIGGNDGQTRTIPLTARPGGSGN